MKDNASELAFANEMLKSFDQQKECGSKVQYPFESRAREIALRLEASSTCGERFGWYRCRWCNYWHVGHAKGSFKARRPVRLLIIVENGAAAVAGFTGSSAAGEAAYGGAKIKGLPDIRRPGDYVFEGAMIHSSRGKFDIVGKSRAAVEDDLRVNWRTPRNT